MRSYGITAAYLVCGTVGYYFAGWIGLFAGLLFAYLGSMLRAPVVDADDGQTHRRTRSFTGRFGRHTQRRTKDHSRELCLILMELSGKIASVDGHVSKAEISFAEVVIADFQRKYDFTRREAIERFTYGKQHDYPVYERLDALKQYLDDETITLCLYLLVRIAKADDKLTEEECKFLASIGHYLGVPAEFLVTFMTDILNEDASDAWTKGDPRLDGIVYRRDNNDELAKAYNALGVKSDASDDQVQRNYRKLLNEYHPDKLHSKGVPDALIKEAERQVIEVRGAWETVKKARGI